MASLHSPKNPFRCEINYVKAIKNIGSVQSFTADSISKCHAMARDMVAAARRAASVTILANDAMYPEFDWRKVMRYEVSPDGKAIAICLYLIDTIEAYRADEQGKCWSPEMPKDTIDYKHNVVEERIFALPAGVQPADIIAVHTEKDGRPFVETESDIYYLTTK